MCLTNTHRSANLLYVWPCQLVVHWGKSRLKVWPAGHLLMWVTFSYNRLLWLPLRAEFTSLIFQSHAISNTEWIHIWEATAGALRSNQQSNGIAKPRPFSHYTYISGEPNWLHVVMQNLIFPFYCWENVIITTKKKSLGWLFTSNHRVCVRVHSSTRVKCMCGHTVGHNGWMCPCTRTLLLRVFFGKSSVFPINTVPFYLHGAGLPSPSPHPPHNSAPVPGTVEICHRRFLVETWNHHQQQRSSAAIYNHCLSLCKAPMG